MDKQYKMSEDDRQMVAKEPTEVYSIHSDTLHLDISLDKNAVVADIKKAIEMIKGITRVRVSDSEESEMSGIDRGLEDIERGNVFHAKDSADLVNQIFG